ncbi:MAG: MarR family transcriptional regulator [Alphaproteobacteria bacterium]|nr:MarR family transcriptional regulator [Alphaproteobacteria bacterium]
MTVEPKKYAEGSFTDDYLLFLLAQASAVASEAFHAELRNSGLRVSTWRILASLYPEEVLTVGALAQTCLLKQPTLTRALDRMERDGLLKRVHSTKDRRSVFVKLTPQGHELTQEKVHMAKSHERRILSGFTKPQAAEIKNVLHSLLDRLGHRKKLTEKRAETDPL